MKQLYMIFLDKEDNVGLLNIHKIITSLYFILFQ